MPFDSNVAIIGGGLCGLALALGLEARGVPYTLYEARASFTEIGAGIAAGPSAVASLRLIRPELGALVYKLATRNLPPHEDVFMLLRRGAPSSSPPGNDGAEERKENQEVDDDDDAAPIADLHMPPTGSMTLHRQEFLQALASQLESGGREADGVPRRTEFQKKLVRYERIHDHHDGTHGVRLEFADGTSATARLAIACDGIHSQVRASMFPAADDPRARAHYNDEGVYRAVLPLDTAAAAIGPDVARRSTIWLGPGGYVVMYPVSGGREVNCGAWVRRPLPPGAGGSGWVAHDRRAQMLADFRAWGPTVRGLLAAFPADVSFWGAYQHRHQPASGRDGPVLLIGDAAHAMPPHQGSGAAIALEDAYVLAEVLGKAWGAGRMERSSHVEAVLRAVEEVRGPRSAMVHRYSCEARDRWDDFHELRLRGAALEEFLAETRRRFERIWKVDMAGEAARAVARMEELLSSLASQE